MLNSWGEFRAAVVTLAAGGLLAAVFASHAHAGGVVRSVNLGLGVKIERVANDKVAPFAQPVSGEPVFFRVRVVNRGSASALRGEVAIELATTDRAATIVGRRGFGRCRVIGRGEFTCVNTIRLRSNDAASVLVRVPAGFGAVRLIAFAGRSRGAPASVAVTRRKAVRSIAVFPTPWNGSWSWTATRRETGQVIVAPGTMDIGQARTTVCSIWSFFGGGIAKGPVSARTWVASWRDSFGTGDWTLTLVTDNEFRGVQHTRRANGAPIETYDVVGQRRSSGGGPVCSDITV